jgi:hypothetical protein
VSFPDVIPALFGDTILLHDPTVMGLVNVTQNLIPLVPELNHLPSFLLIHIQSPSFLFFVPPTEVIISQPNPKVNKKEIKKKMTASKDCHPP